MNSSTVHCPAAAKLSPDLPPDLVEAVLSMLPKDDLIIAARVCPEWRQVALSSEAWRDAICPSLILAAVSIVNRSPQAEAQGGGALLPTLWLTFHGRNFLNNPLFLPGEANLRQPTDRWERWTPFERKVESPADVSWVICKSIWGNDTCCKWELPPAGCDSLPADTLWLRYPSSCHHRHGHGDTTFPSTTDSPRKRWHVNSLLGSLAAWLGSRPAGHAHGAPPATLKMGDGIGCIATSNVWGQVYQVRYSVSKL